MPPAKPRASESEKKPRLHCLPNHIPPHRAQQAGHCFFLWDCSCQGAQSLPCFQLMLPTLGKVPQEGVANTLGKTPVMTRLLPREASSHLSRCMAPSGHPSPAISLVFLLETISWGLSAQSPCWSRDPAPAQGWSQGFSLLSTHPFHQEGASEGKWEGGRSA